MKTKQITKTERETFEAIRFAREQKNAGARDERNNRKVADTQHAELIQRENSFEFRMGKSLIATWTGKARTGLDKVKLQAEYPEAFKACQVESLAWELEIF